MKNNNKKAIVVSIMGRLVKKTASRHYWIYDGTKWVRLGLKKIAEMLHVDTDVIKAAIYVEVKKASTKNVEVKKSSMTEKAVKGFKYWFYNIADSADIAFLVFFSVLGVVIMGLAYATNDTTLIALCTVFDTLMGLCVGLLTFDGYRSAVKFSE